MKTPALQIGVIALSALLMLTVSVLGIKVVQEFSSANLLDEDLAEVNPQLPLSFETRISKGDQLFEAGYYELAAEEYSIAVSIQDNVETAYTKLGLTQLKLGHYEEALSSMKRAYELSPGDATRVNYAISLMRTAQFTEAKNLLDEGNAQDQGTLFYRSLLEAHLGDFDAAEAHLNEAVGLSGSVPSTCLQSVQNAYQSYHAQQGGQGVYLKTILSKAMIDCEEYPLAEILALQVLNEKNDYRDAWIMMGYAQLQMDRFTEAEDSFEQAKKLDGVKSETHYFLGIAHLKQAEYEEAVDSFELALLYDFEPEKEAYLKLAESQNALGNFEDALAAYEYLLKIDQSRLSLFEEPLHIAMNILGDYDRALTLAQESTSYFPQEALSHTYLAEVHLRRGEIEQADSSINIAFDINPNLAESHYIAGQIRVAQNDIEGAKWEFKTTYELSKPGDPLSVEAAEAYNALILNPEPTNP